VAELVERLCRHASTFATGLEEIPDVTVLNDVVFTQVCATFGTDERTEEVVRRLLADGTSWMTGSTWRDRSVLRISVSNWATTDNDVERSLDAVRKAVIEL
jgi:glutamate/tyrosine decarboxylase-like PLP-dependent enzyme